MYYNIKDDVLKTGVLFLKHLLLELHALVVHLDIAAVYHIAVGYKHDGVVYLLELILSSLVALVSVRVVFKCKIAVSFLYLIARGILIYSKFTVQIVHIS